MEFVLDRGGNIYNIYKVESSCTLWILTSRILILLRTRLCCKKARIIINILGMKVKVTWEQVCLVGDLALPRFHVTARVKMGR